MPVLRQKRIYRADLQANPKALYVFGDNVQRVGLGGQADEMRGEPNAIGVATKWTPGAKAADFFSDADYDKAREIISGDLAPVLAALVRGRCVVIPTDGLGTGLSELPTRAPRIFAYLEERIRLCVNSSAYPDWVS